MQKREFTILKEMELQYFEVLRLKRLQSEEDDRLKNLEVIKNRRTEELLDAKSDLKRLQQKIADLNKLLLTSQTDFARNKNNESSITSDKELQAFEQTKSKLTMELEKIEADLFALLEQEESLQLTIKEGEHFLTNLQTSAETLRAEADSQKAQFELEISKQKEELQELKEQLSKEMVDVYEQSILKFGSKKLFTSIYPAGRCKECSFELGRNLESVVAKATTLESCPGCKRILLPQIN